MKISFNKVGYQLARHSVSLESSITRDNLQRLAGGLGWTGCASDVHSDIPLRRKAMNYYMTLLMVLIT